MPTAMGRVTVITAVVMRLPITAAMVVDIMADTHPRTTAVRITVDMPPRITVIDIVEFTARLMLTMVDHGITVPMDGIGTTIATGEKSRTIVVRETFTDPVPVLTVWVLRWIDAAKMKAILIAKDFENELRLAGTPHLGLIISPVSSGNGGGGYNSSIAA